LSCIISTLTGYIAVNIFIFFLLLHVNHSGSINKPSLTIISSCSRLAKWWSVWTVSRMDNMWLDNIVHMARE